MTKDDLISRQPETHEERTETHSCDSIDRQAAIDATSEIVFVEYEDDDPRKEESIILQTKAAIRERIKALPPVQPEILASGEGELNVPDTNVGDMISRKVAMEMLMAQNVIMDGSEYHNGFNAGVNRAQEVIRNLPPVQTEIIHCKDCLYKKICSWENQGAEFCSFGERGKAE